MVAEWVSWQQEKLGRDINTDELIYRLEKNRSKKSKNLKSGIYKNRRA